MKHELMTLPYTMEALVPLMSAETLEYHYAKHHQTYVNKLNELIENTKYAEFSLVDIILSADGAIFNNAAQVYNHDFFWNSLTPLQPEVPKKLEDELVKCFGSVEAFKEEFTSKAIGHFGSGWAWLVQDATGKLLVVSTSNAQNTLADGLKPLLVCDVWEHAYYIDVRNARPKYLENFWKLVNWDFVQSNLA